MFQFQVYFVPKFEIALWSYFIVKFVKTYYKCTKMYQERWTTLSRDTQFTIPMLAEHKSKTSINIQHELWPTVMSETKLAQIFAVA